MQKHFKLILAALVVLFSFAATAQTNVSGGIYTNTTWTKVNSPYIVTDTVVVFPGVTLTIEPGVEVRFEDDMRLEIRQASLMAIGTNIDSITFTSNSSNPHPGSWGEIYLNWENGSMDSRFDYCNFYYANFAIHIWIYTSGPTSLSVNHSLFSFNNEGINSYASQGGAIYLDNSDFIDNINYGIHSNHVGGGEVINCIFLRNNTGIVINRALVSNCIIDSNEVVGIIVTRLNSVINCQIRHNGIGLEDDIFDIGDNVITGNIIEKNDIGIKIAHSVEQITSNQICSNRLYDLYYNVTFGSNISMPNNCWCSADSSIIATKIYDGYDNLNLALVTFMPIDTTQCYLTGCNLSVSSTVTNATCPTCTDGSATATVSGGTAPFIYTWNTSPLQTTQTATGLPSGTYTVCVSDANGCTVCTSVFVDSTNCTGFSVTAQSTTASCSTCADASAWVTTTGGAAPYSYTWFTNPIQSNDTATGLLPGSYVVCVLDANGCSVCDTVTVGTGNCSAYFDLYPDSIPQQYYAVNRASGSTPLTYVWSWGDRATDTAAFPTHTYATAGLYTICLSITDAAGCTDSYCNPYYLLKAENAMVTVNVVDALPTAITPLATDADIRIYPNPANDILTIDFPAEVVQAEIKLYDVAGALQQVTRASGKQTTLSLDEFAAGIYFLEVRAGETVSRKKVVLQ